MSPQGNQVEIKREEYADNFILSPHHHDDKIQIIYAPIGKIQIVTEQNLYLLPQGSGLVIPAGVEHNLMVPDSADVRVVNLDTSLNYISKLKSCALVSISPLFSAVVDELSRYNRTFEEDTPEARLCMVLIDCIEKASLNPTSLPIPADRRIRQIVDGLLNASSDKKTIEEWCSLIGASRRTITRLFVSETGMNYQSYRQHLQIYRSLALLHDTKNINTVAYDVGYESPSAFSAAFKKIMKMTPAEYVTSVSHSPD